VVASIHTLHEVCADCITYLINVLCRIASVSPPSRTSTRLHATNTVSSVQRSSAHDARRTVQSYFTSLRQQLDSDEALAVHTVDAHIYDKCARLYAMRDQLSSLTAQVLYTVVV
jgi:hypothetical protein